MIKRRADHSSCVLNAGDGVTSVASVSANCFLAGRWIAAAGDATGLTIGPFIGVALAPETDEYKSGRENDEGQFSPHAAPRFPTSENTSADVPTLPAMRRTSPGPPQERQRRTGST